MPQAKVSDEEFVHTFQSTGGSIKRTSELIGVGERAAHSRRRRIEKKRGQLLLSSMEGSPDIGMVELEFPDWNEVEIKNGLHHFILNHRTAIAFFADEIQL